MFSLVLAAALAGQYPSPQAPTYGAPTYGAPMQYAAPPTYSAPMPITYAAPSVTMLGAGAVVPPGPFGLMLGHLGRKLEMHSWPRVQPMVAQPAAMQTVYLQMSAPMVQQAVYSVPAPTYAAPPPPTQYGAPPQPPAKNPPQQYQAPTTYGSPQAPQGGGGMYGAPRPNDAAPPVPKA